MSTESQLRLIHTQVQAVRARGIFLFRLCKFNASGGLVIHGESNPATHFHLERPRTFREWISQSFLVLGQNVVFEIVVLLLQVLDIFGLQMSWRNIFLQNPRWQVPLQLVLQIVLGLNRFHVFFFVRAPRGILFVNVCAQAGGVKALNRRPLTNQINYTQGVRDGTCLPVQRNRAKPSS